MLLAETKRSQNTTARLTNRQVSRGKPQVRAKAPEPTTSNLPVATAMQPLQARRSWLPEMTSLLSMSPDWWKCSAQTKSEKRTYLTTNNRKSKSSSRIMFGTHKTKTRMLKKSTSLPEASRCDLKTAWTRCWSEDDGSWKCYLRTKDGSKCSTSNTLIS